MALNFIDISESDVDETDVGETDVNEIDVYCRDSTSSQVVLIHNSSSCREIAWKALDSAVHPSHTSENGAS